MKFIFMALVALMFSANCFSQDAETVMRLLESTEGKVFEVRIFNENRDLRKIVDTIATVEDFRLTENEKFTRITPIISLVKRRDQMSVEWNSNSPNQVFIGNYLYDLNLVDGMWVLTINTQQFEKLMTRKNAKISATSYSIPAK